MGRVLALDVGTKTIGLAWSDPGRMLASPVTTVRRKGVSRDVEAIQRCIAGEDVTHLLVGLPFELDGSERRSARLARQVGNALAEATRLPLTWIDERYSSVEAERRLIEADVSRRRRKQVIDQQAAVVLLQSYLDHGDWSQISSG